MSTTTRAAPQDSPPQTFAPHTRPLTSSEAEELAGVLRVRSAALKAARTGSPEAAPRGATYDELVADPLKSRLAPDPDFFADIKRDVALERIRRYLPAVSACELRLLDVGCGTGALLRSLEPHFADVWGCDPSPSMVRRAGKKARWMPAELELPFPNASFDVATCACVYHHIEPRLRRRHLQEILRVLRPGGILMIFEHNPRNPLTRLIVRRCPIDAAASLLDGRLTRRLRRGAGFDRVSNRYYLFLPQRLYRRIGKCESVLSWTTLGGQYCAVGRKPR